jgi:PKD repeat protein
MMLHISVRQNPRTALISSIFLLLCICFAVAPASAAPTAAFSATLTYLDVQFHDQSTGIAPLSYLWDFGDGSSSTLQSPSHTYSYFGTYVVNLTVTDIVGSNSVKHPVMVKPINAPVAVPGGPYVIAVGDDLHLDGSGSYDADIPYGDSIVSYQWDLDDDGVFDDATGQSPVLTWIQLSSILNPHTGVLYPVSLMVTDTTGRTNMAYTSLSITSLPPKAAFSDTPTYLDVQFTDQSTGTAPLSYLWDFGDSATSTLPSPAHTYAAAGTYNVKLTVTNIAGSNDVTHSVRVTALPGVTISVKKSASATSLPASGPVTYTYLVESTGSLAAVTLTDDKLGSINGPASGDSDTNGVLDAGEIWTYTKTTTLTATTTNIATATGRELTGAPVSAQSNTVTVQVGTIPAPEFPTAAFPVMVISTLAFLVMIYRRRE